MMKITDAGTHFFSHVLLPHLQIAALRKAVMSRYTKFQTLQLALADRTWAFKMEKTDVANRASQCSLWISEIVPVSNILKN